MKIFKYPSAAAEKKLKSIVGREIDFRKKDVQAVARILREIKKEGDDALIRYSRQFDAPKMKIQGLAATLKRWLRPGKKSAARSCGR